MSLAMPEYVISALRAGPISHKPQADIRFQRFSIADRRNPLNSDTGAVMIEWSGWKLYWRGMSGTSRSGERDSG